MILMMLVGASAPSTNACIAEAFFDPVSTRTAASRAQSFSPIFERDKTSS
jgi:hypothetical protein